MARQILSRRDVERATFVDFEGRIDAPPVLLGVTTFDGGEDRKSTRLNSSHRT